MSELSELGQKIFEDRYAQPGETPEALWRRVAHGIAKVETDPVWEERFYEVLKDWKFVPAGRILTAAGTDQQLTYYNCNVLASPKDSREGIMDSVKIALELQSRGGGVGVNISSLRPRDAKIRGVNGKSSGAVSWGELYSDISGKVCQGGCIAGYEEVLTDQGSIRVDELADRIEHGDAVNALTHLGPRRITHAFRNGVKLVFRVSTASGLRVDATMYHQFACRGADGEIVTIPLHNLNIGSEILVLEQCGEPYEDTITSIVPAMEKATFDFEVEEVHLLSFNGFYTSNSRRGATLLLLADWHPDIFEFINAKRESGRLTNANVSVAVSDALMQAVKDDADWDLQFPDTEDPEYDTLWDGDLKQWVDTGHPVRTYRTVKARELWSAITAAAHASGEPGVLFLDRCNAMSNTWYTRKIVGCNPCVVGSTLVDTIDGQIPIKDVKPGTRIRTLDGYHTVAAVYDNGAKPIWRVRFSNGVDVNCTKDHRFWTCRHGRFVWVEASELDLRDTVFSFKNGEENVVFVKGAYPTGNKENVYDLSEPVTHSYVANGVVVHNCGEQPLAANAVCNLGAINLARFVEDGEVKWGDLSEAISTAVRFLDDVIDVTPYFFDDQMKAQLEERRIGLGVMGLAEYLIRLGLRYGSQDAADAVDKLFRFIAIAAYRQSVLIVDDKCAFPLFDKDRFLESGYMKKMPGSICTEVANGWIRNAALLTCAPTGSIGTMVGTSTGIEPYYSWSYTRKSRLGTHEERVPVYEEWCKAHPNEPLPDYFATAMDLTPEEHIRMQAAIQRWVDSSISKTINLPATATVEDVSKAYRLLYETGCKGGTVFRDGCRDEQVLTANTEPAPEPVPATVRSRPYALQGVTVSRPTPVGTAHITMNDDEHGPFEVFVDVGKGGSDIRGMAEALGRVISLSLRIPSEMTPRERVCELVDQLDGIGGRASIGFGKSRVLSLPDALAKALAQQYLSEATTDLPEATKSIRADLCPQCGEVSLVREEGCSHCLSCGYSRC
jgi:ribonucleotide reductase alpha subunit